MAFYKNSIPEYLLQSCVEQAVVAMIWQHTFKNYERLY